MCKHTQFAGPILSLKVLRVVHRADVVMLRILLKVVLASVNKDTWYWSSLVCHIMKNLLTHSSVIYILPLSIQVDQAD